MRHYFYKHKNIIKRVVVYAVMTLSVFLLASSIVFFVLGYRFDVNVGKVTQYSILQFSSEPSGAMVAVDGVTIGSKTPLKTTVSVGEHKVVMWRDGYDKWEKTVNLKGGVVVWLNYALMIPSKLVTSSTTSYQSVYDSVSSVGGRMMLIQERADMPIFNLVDSSSDSVKTTKLTIPGTIYSQSSNTGANHVFDVANWDNDGRYAIIKHSFSGSEEWLVLDTQSADLTKNITKIFNIPISYAHFSGSNSNDIYVLNQSDIRKLNISGGTISKPFVSSVDSFDIYDETNVITYVGTLKSDNNQRFVGVYRDGDDISHNLRSAKSSEANLNIATARYFGENYVAISDGVTVDILSGSYPNTPNDDETSMKVVTSFKSDKDIKKLSFSPSGKYVLVQSGSYFASYDIEYGKFKSSNIVCDSNADNENVSIKWLDDNYIWSESCGTLAIREFDGDNIHNIATVAKDQDVMLTHNKKYIYSISNDGTKYSLQRTLLVLP